LGTAREYDVWFSNLTSPPTRFPDMRQNSRRLMVATTLTQQGFRRRLHQRT